MHGCQSWEDLPVAVLEDILLRLPVRNRLYAALSCKRWLRVFFSKRLWANFSFKDKSFCRRRLFMREGHRTIEYELNYQALHSCLRNTAFAIRQIQVEPMHDYHALYEFMQLLTNMLEWSAVPATKTSPAKTLMPLMHSFLFSFACRTSGDLSNPTPVLIGTGGRMFQGLLKLLSQLPPLHSLGLRNLRLNRGDVLQLLLPVAGSVGECLLSLELVNCSSSPGTSLWDVLNFRALNHLVLSAQHVTEQFIHSLLPSDNRQLPCPKLSFLTVSYDDITMLDLEPLLFDGFARMDDINQLATEETWRILYLERPSLNVCIELRPRLRHFPAALQSLFLPGAKVVHISIAAARLKLTGISLPGGDRPQLRRLDFFDDEELPDQMYIEPLLPRLVSLHMEHLESIVQPNLPRVHGRRDFLSRCDASLVATAICCRRLRILVVRERVSTIALLLFLEFASSSFCSLFVRRNAILRRSTFSVPALLTALSECSSERDLTNLHKDHHYYNGLPNIPSRQQIVAAVNKLAPIGRSVALTQQWIATRLRHTHSDFQFLSDKVFCNLSPRLANMHGSTFAYS